MEPFIYVPFLGIIFEFERERETERKRRVLKKLGILFGVALCSFCKCSQEFRRMMMIRRTSGGGGDDGFDIWFNAHFHQGSKATLRPAVLVQHKNNQGFHGTRETKRAFITRVCISQTRGVSLYTCLIVVSL